ncbi:MAG: AraC family transcriptional regulator [Desulfobulbaceae bacterium]|nr:AraC family transcriptional regulator [Desulfobulbaceae bacterium]
MMLKELSPAETRQQLDAKGVDTSPLAAFAYLDSDQNIRYDWHAHQRHQLIFAFSGTLRLEAENGIYLLPPQRAAWIPAGVSHRTTLRKVVSASVFFAPSLVSSEPAHIRIIPAAPILREMVRYALRWPPERDPDDTLAASFFQTMGLLCGEWQQTETGFRLPAAKSGQIAAAMEYTLAHLAAATLEGASQAAALSPRQFRRRFLAESTIGWQQFHHQARMLRAMELLATPQAAVTEVAYAIGFNSLSAFAKSFARFTGQSPKEYRRSGAGERHFKP